MRDERVLPPSNQSGIGIGAVGLQGEPSRDRKRPDLCAEYGHPGNCFNSWLDRTWCLCGERIYEGNASKHPACCDGPLIEYDDPDEKAGISAAIGSTWEERHGYQ